MKEEEEEKGNSPKPPARRAPRPQLRGGPLPRRGPERAGPAGRGRALTETELADVSVVGPEQEQRDEQHGQPGEGAAAAAQPPPQRHPAALSAAHRRAAARAGPGPARSALG